MDKSLQNPGPPALLSSNAAADWNTIFSVVSALVSSAIKVAGWSDDQIPLFVEDYPKERTGAGFDQRFDVILWNVQSSVMAPTNNAGSRVPHGAQYRGTLSPSNKYGYTQQVWGWWEHVVVSFTIHAKSNSRANELAAWFHRTMMRAAFRDKLFMSYGVTEFRYAGRQADKKTQEFGQELYQRDLQYQMRLNIQDVYDVKVLENITINLGKDTGSTIEINRDGLEPQFEN